MSAKRVDHSLNISGVFAAGSSSASSFDRNGQGKERVQLFLREEEGNAVTPFTGAADKSHRDGLMGDLFHKPFQMVLSS